MYSKWLVIFFNWSIIINKLGNRDIVLRTLLVCMITLSEVYMWIQKILTLFLDIFEFVSPQQRSEFNHETDLNDFDRMFKNRKTEHVEA